VAVLSCAVFGLHRSAVHWHTRRQHTGRLQRAASATTHLCVHWHTRRQLTGRLQRAAPATKHLRAHCARARHRHRCRRQRALTPPPTDRQPGSMAAATSQAVKRITAVGRFAAVFGRTPLVGSLVEVAEMDGPFSDGPFSARIAAHCCSWYNKHNLWQLRDILT